MEFRTVGRIADGFFRYQAWPTVTRDAAGVLYAASSGHRLGHVCPFGKNYLYISRDEGNSWEGPIVANDTYLDDRDAGLCAWGEGNLLLSWFNLAPVFYDGRAKDPKPHNGALRTPMGQAGMQAWRDLPEENCKVGSYARLSHDGGKTWGEAVQIPLTSPHGPAPTADGRLLFIGKEFRWNGELEKNAIYAMESRDEGKTWTLLSQLPCPEGYDWSRIHEPHGIETSDGTIVAALRAEDPTSPDNKLLTYVCCSKDGGKTFSNPVRVAQGAPAHLLEHSSGAVIMSYSKRIEPHGQYARVSYDSGETWSDEFAVAPPSPDWDHGYPSTVELSDGSLLTVYYQKYPGDTYNSVLSSRWELPKK